MHRTTAGSSLVPRESHGGQRALLDRRQTARSPRMAAHDGELRNDLRINTSFSSDSIQVYSLKGNSKEVLNRNRSQRAGRQLGV